MAFGAGLSAQGEGWFSILNTVLMAYQLLR
jgi:hypothetical protein